MSGSHFERIAQALHQQKRIMDDLLAENRELRQQLTDLRQGRGIFLDINGQRFALNDLTGNHNNIPLMSAEPTHTVVSMQQTPQTTITPVPTNTVTEISPSKRTTTAENQEQTENNEKNKQPGFLEEVMLNEFANAMTSPIATWQGPTKEQQPSQNESKPANEEERKATLRQELHGSFLLE